MQNIHELLAEFPPVSKAEWLAQVSKSLKGKTLEDLDWPLAEGLTVSPFVHADDFPVGPPAALTSTSGWEINEDIPDTTDPAAANAQALAALEGGAESLTFQLQKPATPALLTELLRDIHVDFISLHFSGPGVQENPGAVLAALQAINSQRLQANGHRPPATGSLAYDPAADPGRLRDWRYLADLLTFIPENFPHFRCLTVDGRAAGGSPETVADDLAGLLQRGNFYLEKLTERGLTAQQVAGQMQFSLMVGKSYFVEIARLRAFNILWLNVLQAWQAPLEYPVLDVRLAPGAYTDEVYTNMIRATTMGMSAVMGGARRLTVLPYDAGREPLATYPPTFGRRMARNVQHLLKMESFLDEATDPAAGSYYVEKLTQQIAGLAWQKFQSNQKK